MTEYDLIRDWTLRAGIDEETAKRVLFRLRLESGFKSFLDHEDLRDDLETAEKEVEALQKKIEQLGNMIETLEGELDAAKERIVELEEECDAS